MKSKEFDEVYKRTDLWLCIDNIINEVPKIALLCGLFGGIYQFFILLIIGNGTWILSYFSTSYALIEGLNYFIYMMGIIVFSTIVFSMVEDLNFKIDPNYYKIAGGSVIIFSFSFFIFLGNYFYLRYILFFLIAPICVGIAMIRGNKLNILKDFSEASKESNKLLVIMFFSSLLIWSFINLRINTRSYEELNIVKKQFSRDEMPITIYMNDKYLFLGYSKDFKKGSTKNNVTIINIDKL